MELKVHCLLGASFADFHQLPAILASSTVLNTYQQGYTSSTQMEEDKIFYSDYHEHDVPFHQIESLLCSPNEINACLLTKKRFCIQFLKTDEVLMRRFPKTSFFLRNSVIDEDGNQTLLQSQKCRFLVISLYKNQKDTVTIPL